MRPHKSQCSLLSQLDTQWDVAGVSNRSKKTQFSNDIWPALGDFAVLLIANDTRPAMRDIKLSSIANAGPWQKPINRHSVILHKFTMAVVKKIYRAIHRGRYLTNIDFLCTATWRFTFTPGLFFSQQKVHSFARALLLTTLVKKVKLLNSNI